jgi:DnaD/phage-associated family protein
MVNQTIAEDAEFNSLSLEAQLVYLRTIPHLDRDGLINGHPSVLWGKVAPLMPDLLPVMPRIIKEMADAGLIISYAHNKTQIIFFKGFTKNQAGMRYDREPASTLPIPPGYRRTDHGLEPITTPDTDQTTPPTNGTVPHEDLEQSTPVPRTSGNLPAIFRQSSGNLPPEENRIEKKTTTTEHAREAEPEPESKSGGGGGGDLPKNRNRQTDEEYAQICRKFESEGFGTLTAIMGEEINALMNEHPTSTILEAMAIAVTANNRQLRYVRGILNRWRANGRNDKRAQANGQAPPGSTLKTFKRWMLDTYNCDSVDVVLARMPNASEALFRTQYEQYRSQNQPTH